MERAFLTNLMLIPTVQVKALEKEAVENVANNLMVVPTTVLGNLSNNIVATTSQGGFNYFNTYELVKYI